MAIVSVSQQSEKIRGKFKRFFRNKLCCCWRPQHNLFATERNNNKTIILVRVIKLSPLALGITEALVNGLRKHSWWKFPEKIKVRIHIAFLSNQNQSKFFQNTTETSPKIFMNYIIRGVIGEKEDESLIEVYRIIE